ncbi:MAG: PAS domain-containing protein, partial [Lachnospiraceae bacterium]
TAKCCQLEPHRLACGSSQVLSKKEEDKEIYQLWHEYFSECEPFNQFKAKYNKQGNMCGCLVYEAHDEEKILFADETLVHIFGCQNYMEFYKYVNGSFKNIVHPDDIERVEMEIANQIYDSDDSLDRVKYRIVRKDGEVRIIDDIGHRVFTENGGSVFYVFIVDVTDSMEKKTI